MIRIPALLTAGLLVLLGLPGYVVTARDYASHFAHISRHQHAIALTAARDESIGIGVRIDDGIGGRWASEDGLQLSIDGLNGRLQVVGPRPPDWGDKLRTSAMHGGDPYDVIGTFTIPAAIGGPEQRQLRGSLTGHLTYPSGGIIFEDVTMEVTIPVEILLLPKNGYEWASGRLRSRVFALADMALAAILILLAALALMRALPARRRAREGNPDVASAGSVLADAGIGVVIVLLVGGGGLMGILSVATFGGIDHPAGDIIATNLAIAALAASAAGVSLLALLMDPS